VPEGGGESEKGGRKRARTAAKVVAVAALLGAGALVARAQLRSEDTVPKPVALHVEVLPPGTFEAAHTYAPYYVVPRRRVAGPSQLSRVSRNKFVTQPEAALERGAIAGSPQIVRVALRAASSEQLVVEAIRFKVRGRARPLKGWYTATTSCGFTERVRTARVNLDARRPRARYFDAQGKRSPGLALTVGRGQVELIELQAATRRRRISWTAELTVSAPGGRSRTFEIDNGGRPFRVTSRSASRGYKPLYGATEITGFARERAPGNANTAC